MKQERTFALVKAGIVQNIIVAEPEFMATIAAQYDAVPEATAKAAASMGAEFKNAAFVAKPVEMVK